MLINGTFDFKLRKTITVHGVEGDVDMLTFHECGNGYDDYYMKLRKHVLSAQMSAPKFMKQFEELKPQREENIASGEELKPLHEINEADHEADSKSFSEFIKMVLGTTDELSELVKVFGFMVKSTGGDPVCTAHNQRVKEGAWNQLHIEDKIDAAVSYCSFFGIGLDKPLNNASGAVSDSPTVVKVL